MARSLGNADRRQISWVHWRHITEEGLDKVVQEVINAYNRFGLPKRWELGRMLPPTVHQMGPV